MRLPATALPLLVAALLAGCGGSDSGSGSGDEGASSQTATTAAAAPPAAAGPAVTSATVDIRSFKYKPVTVTVKKGGRVRWMNFDDAAHTATADQRTFDTQTIDKGGTRAVTMTRQGTFAYHCDFHPFMKATVVVR